MIRFGDLITKQCKTLLENKQQAFWYAVVLSILPFASWLSVVLVALVTLRKGAKSGFEILLPALVVHSVPLMMRVPLESVLINTLVTYVPCFLAALALRKTANWQVVFGVLFLQVLLGAFIIQLLAPDFVVDQFNQLKTLLGQNIEYQQVIESGVQGIGVFVLAQLFLGIQLVSTVVFTIIYLMFARSTQSKLYLPGGFKQELLAFRSGRLFFLVLVAVSLGSYYETPLALNLLPFVLSYFLFTGLSLAHFIFGRKSQGKVLVLLLLFILLKPAFVLFAYIVFGSLDSLFNFRLYLPARAREST